MAHKEGAGGVQPEEVCDGGQHIHRGGDLVHLGGLQVRRPDEEVGVLEHVHVVHALDVHVQGVVHHVVVVVVGVEDEDGVLQQVGLGEGIHQLPDELVGLHGPGHGVDVVAVGSLGSRLGGLGVGLVAGVVLTVGTVARKGDDEGEEGVPLGHLVKAVDEVAVHLVVFHGQVLVPIVLLIAQVGVDGAPVVDVSTAVVEGAGGVPLLAEEVGQGVGEAVVPIDGGGNPPGGGEQAGVGHKLRVEGARRDVSRGVVVGEGDRLRLQLGQVGHVGLLEHPGVNGLQLDQDDVFPCQQAGVLVVRLGGLVLGHILVHLLPLLVTHGVGGEHLPDQVPDGVLVQAADHEGVGAVAEFVVGLAPVILLGGLPDHRIRHGEVVEVGKGDDPHPHQAGRHPCQDGSLHRLRGDDPQQPAGGHHQQHRDGRPHDDLPVDLDVGRVHKLPRSPIGEHGEGEEPAEGTHKPAVGDGDDHKGHQGHTPDEPPGNFGQEEHQPGKHQGPPQGEQTGRQELNPHDPRPPVGKPQGEVQHKIGQEEGDDVQVGFDPRNGGAVQPVPGEALPEGQAQGLALLLFFEFLWMGCHTLD